MATPTDHLQLAAMLTQLTPDRVAAMPPALREKLSSALYRAHVLCEQAARRPEPPTLYVTADATERLQAQQRQASGVLADLRDGQQLD
jgi:hypothetical protein